MALEERHQADEKIAHASDLSPPTHAEAQATGKKGAAIVRYTVATLACLTCVS